MLRRKNPDFDEIVSGTSSIPQENYLPRQSINFDQKLDSNGFMGVNKEKFKKAPFDFHKYPEPASNSSSSYCQQNAFNANTFRFDF